MNYLQLSFNFTSVEEYQQDLLIAALADAGFDTFEDSETGFDAFILASHYSETVLNDVLLSFSDVLEYTYEVKQIEPKNWNEEWEKNFNPLIINEDCYVRATFHEPKPQYKYQIVIDPKMAFGTGHHQTTTMMMRYILETEFTNKVVLDMGAGTGILGILASKLGAKHITAIDNDEVCYRSAIENASLNSIENLTSLCGSKESIPIINFRRCYPVVWANVSNSSGSRCDCNSF
jgi:ribosomal protein L11 methyltransferase